MLEAIGVGVRIGGRTILDDVDLAVAPGRLTVLIGPNGAGKSTLLKAISGERRPNAGEVRLNGRDIAMLKPRDLARQRAVLVQSPSLGAAFTVAEVVGLAIPEATPHAIADALIARALAAVDLAGFAGRIVNRLSGGEQQRVHAARALAQLWASPEDGQPRYLLLDEPTAHLDPAQQLLLLKLARDQADDGGVLAILHDINLAVDVADQVAVMRAGRIVAAGPPATALTTELLGEVYGIGFEAFPIDGRSWFRPRPADLRKAESTASPPSGGRR